MTMRNTKGLYKKKKEKIVHANKYLFDGGEKKRTTTTIKQ